MPVPRDDETSPVTDGDLWLLLRSTWFAAGRLLALETARYDLTPEQATILRILRDRGGPLTVRQLEDITMRQHNSLTILINRMLGAGLLQRERQPNGKGYAISLSVKGKDRLGQVSQVSIETTFSVLSDRERTALHACLTPLYRKARDLLTVSHQPPFLQLLKSRAETGEQTATEPEAISTWELWDLLAHTGFAVSRLRELELAPLGLTMMQSLVFKILDDNGGTITTKTLEDSTMRQHHSISTLINRMTKMGLVNTQRMPRGRRHVISFTPAGRDLYGHITTYAIEMTLATLNESRKRDLAQCLEKLLIRARDLLGLTEPFPVTIGGK